MIPLFKVYMDTSVDKAVLEILHSGWIGQGDEVKRFEHAISKRVGNPRCLGVSAGTHGLHLALRLAGIDRGSEVITTPLTCFATTASILMQGGRPVWADIKTDDLNIDPNSIKTRITKYTRAIMVVHWGGYPCDMEEIWSLANENDLFVIEDAAHAFGATYKDSFIGDCKYSDFCVHSFQAVKHLNSGGDGGVLFTKSNDDYGRGRDLRWFGIDREDPNRWKNDSRCEKDIPEWGYKYNMNDVTARIGLANLRSINRLIHISQDNIIYYREKLKDIDGITLLQNSEDRSSPGWIFTILVENRNDFCRKMEEKGIMVSQVHERNDKHTCVKEFVRTDLPALDYIVERMIALPCGWWVKKSDREYIAESIKGGW